MNLVDGRPYWPQKNQLEPSFPKLEEDLETEVLVVGGGITGALVALAFHRAGHQVTLIDKGKIAYGSTSASTALLQYEIDVNLVDLIKKIGRDRAVRAYQLCGEAIEKVARIATEFACDFTWEPSVYLTKKETDLKKLKAELEARRSAGFDVEWVDDWQLKEMYDITALGGIWSALGASIDPYQLTYQILTDLQKEGARIYEETAMSLEPNDKNSPLKTEKQTKIVAHKVIFATGYESQKFLQEKVVHLHSTYALVSQPLAEDAGRWLKNRALIWDTQQPYLYARLTPENRIIMGGADLPFENEWWREKLLAHSSQKVIDQFQSYFPELSFQVDSVWAGTFGETNDGLAYIGETPEWPDAYFALGFGGNGITYSALAAELLLKLYHGDESEDLALFRFGR